MKERGERERGGRINNYSQCPITNYQLPITNPKYDVKQFVYIGYRGNS